MAWVAVGSAVAGATVSSVLNRPRSSGSASSTSQMQLDPRMANIVYGSGQSVLRPGATAQMGIGTDDDYKRYLNNLHVQKYGVPIPQDEASQKWLTQGIADLKTAGHQVEVNPAGDFQTDNGLLGRVNGLLDTPQNAGMSAFGNGMDAYLKDYGRGAFDNNMRSADALRDTRFNAPTAQAASMQAAHVNAPSQNDLNLSPAFGQMIYGDSAQNPYLQGALQKGVNQANNAFGNMAHDYGQALQDNLAGIRGGAIVNNSMGSSRQGIAEGKAFDSFNTNMGRALSQYGQNLTDNIMGAQSNAFENGQNRALSAMQGLNSNQYGTAFQNAGFNQQANQANAGFQQQANLANMQAQLQTNALNSDNQKAGTALSSGLLGQATGYGKDQDTYAMGKLSQGAGILSPFTGFGSTTQSAPMYSNTAGNALGGGLLGYQLYKNLSNGGNGSYNNFLGNNAGVMNSQGLSPYDISGAF